LQDLYCNRNKQVDFAKYIATILKLFYDADVLSEEFLLGWGEGK